MDILLNKKIIAPYSLHDYKTCHLYYIMINNILLFSIQNIAYYINHNSILKNNKFEYTTRSITYVL